MWCEENEAVLLTSDLDFGYLLIASQSACASVCILRIPDPNPRLHGEEVVRVLMFLRENQAGVFLARFDGKNLRVRTLPLESP